ncbi:MAG: sugar ABC transporter substrate-binding protein [Vulcanimicrobiota bacterium]
MKKLLWLMLLLALVGCQRPPRDDKIHLEFWTMSLEKFEPYIRSRMEAFEASHPEVKLEWIDLPLQAAQQKLMAGIAAGEPPDLVNLNTEFALVLAQNQALVSMTEAVPPETQQLYFPGLWQAAEFEGQVYAIPWYVTTRVVMYNKRILAEAGLDPEHPPADWDELAAYARQVHARTKYVGYMPSIKIVNDWTMWKVPVVDYSDMTARFNSPEGVARLDWYRQMFLEGVIPPESLTDGYRGALDRYKSGSLAFLEAGPQLLLELKADAPGVYANTGVAPLPASPSGEVPAATMNFVVPRSARHRQLAVEFGLFLTNPDNQLAFDKLVPILPSTRATAEDPFFQTGSGEPLLDEAIRISIDQLARARDFSLGLPKQRDLNRALKENVEAALAGKLSSREALDRAAERWNEILAAYR